MDQESHIASVRFGRKACVADVNAIAAAFEPAGPGEGEGVGAHETIQLALQRVNDAKEMWIPCACLSPHRAEQAPSILRPEWGVPTRIGSAAHMDRIKRVLLEESRQAKRKRGA